MLPGVEGAEGTGVLGGEGGSRWTVMSFGAGPHHRDIGQAQAQVTVVAWDRDMQMRLSLREYARKHNRRIVLGVQLQGPKGAVFNRQCPEPTCWHPTVRYLTRYLLQNDGSEFTVSHFG